MNIRKSLIGILPLALVGIFAVCRWAYDWLPALLGPSAAGALVAVVGLGLAAWVITIIGVTVNSVRADARL